MEITIDCREIRSEAEFHEIIAAKLHLPAYYGANLDALYDCLTSVSRKTTLNLIGVNAMLRELGPFARAALNMMERAERENGLYLTINMM